MSRLRRDGVSLFYEEAEVGEPPMLLVHGLACDHTHLTPQLEHFSGNHRVVTVDLRGHGQSDAPRQEYTIEGFADDLAWVCARLGLENPVVVGHSLAGRICLALAASYPDLPVAVVALDSTIVPPQDRLEMMRPFIESLRTPAYPEELRRFSRGSSCRPTTRSARRASSPRCSLPRNTSSPRRGRCAISPTIPPPRPRPAGCRYST